MRVWVLQLASYMTRPAPEWGRAKRAGAIRWSRGANGLRVELSDSCIRASFWAGLASCSPALGVLGTPTPTPASAGGCTFNILGGSNGDDFYTDPTGLDTEFDAGDGYDYAEMRDCHDSPFGQGGGDELHGASGFDFVDGGSGSDQPSNCHAGHCGLLLGGADTDTIHGGNGDDKRDDSQSGGDEDSLYGEADNDLLNANDGDTNDVAHAGTGTDNCNTDSGDARTGCES